LHAARIYGAAQVAGLLPQLLGEVLGNNHGYMLSSRSIPSEEEINRLVDISVCHLQSLDV